MGGGKGTELAAQINACTEMFRTRISSRMKVRKEGHTTVAVRCRIMLVQQQKVLLIDTSGVQLQHGNDLSVVYLSRGG